MGPKRSITERMSKIEIIEQALSALVEGNLSEADRLIQDGYPFRPLARATRKYTLVESMRTFLRDGFIDRYSGTKLLYPGAMRVLSLGLPSAFPYQMHWKTSETHMAYWHFYPTVDHVVPIARGGKDEESNFVTTSQLRNSAKAHWLIEELGWEIYPPGRLNNWDGLLGQTRAYIEKNPKVLDDELLRKWHMAAITAEKSFSVQIPFS